MTIEEFNAGIKDKETNIRICLSLLESQRKIKNYFEPGEYKRINIHLAEKLQMHKKDLEEFKLQYPEYAI